MRKPIHPQSQRSCHTHTHTHTHTQTHTCDSMYCTLTAIRTQTHQYVGTQTNARALVFSEAHKQIFGISEAVFDLRSVTPFWAGQAHPRLQFDDISSYTGAWRGSSSWCSSPWIRSEPSRSGTEASMRTGSETDEEKERGNKEAWSTLKQAKCKESRGHDVNLHQKHCNCKYCVFHFHMFEYSISVMSCTFQKNISKSVC